MLSFPPGPDPKRCRSLVPIQSAFAPSWPRQSVEKLLITAGFGAPRPVTRKIGFRAPPPHIGSSPSQAQCNAEIHGEKSPHFLTSRFRETPYWRAEPHGPAPWTDCSVDSRLKGHPLATSFSKHPNLPYRHPPLYHQRNLRASAPRCRGGRPQPRLWEGRQCGHSVNLGGMAQTRVEQSEHFANIG